MGKSLVITEKPSVARDIVAALGGFEASGEHWESDGYVVTFSVGHIVELLSPEEFDEIGRLVRKLGFGMVASGPFVRSSYHAGEMASEWADGLAREVSGETH